MVKDKKREVQTPHKALCIGVSPLNRLTVDWDSRVRTCNCLIQSQVPYQFGYIPFMQHKKDNAKLFSFQLFCLKIIIFLFTPKSFMI